MSDFLSALNRHATTLNDLMWSDFVLYILLCTGLLFTIWSGFMQWRALTHGTAAVSGKYSDKRDPGALNHFQALATALSGTVGLGNIGGVAIAIALGGPGAVFWMWVVGLLGMALKATEVTLSMLYREVDASGTPYGGPMYVAKKAFTAIGWPRLGAFWGGTFVVTLLIATLGGGSMFQAWNVGAVTQLYFGLPSWITGVILATLVALTVIGGIKRIGKVTGTLVPFMCGLYLVGGLYVLTVNAAALPDLFVLIFTSAFSEHEATGAFLGGTAGTAFLWGMKRALYSNEAGQGSSPMAHSAAKTDEPAREGIVAGLEPFIDTLIVCTISAMVILSTGVWKHAAEARYSEAPTVVPTGDLGHWSIETTAAPAREDGGNWSDGDAVFIKISADANRATGNTLHRIEGTVKQGADGFVIEWGEHVSATHPSVVDTGVYVSYAGAQLAGRAFDSAQPGLGKWLITMAVWLFAISTMISWAYYGEQGMVYLMGKASVLPYQVLFCALAIVANLGLLTTARELDTLTTFGTGVMLWANIPLMLLFGHQAMRAYKDYIRRLDAGEMKPDHARSSLGDLLKGKDVE
jgi:AGCS family alanine or glycine:cation symporter